LARPGRRGDRAPPRAASGRAARAELARRGAADAHGPRARAARGAAAARRGRPARPLPPRRPHPHPAVHGLRGASHGRVKPGAVGATAAVDVTWRLGRERTWRYPGELEVRPAPDTEEGWRIHWAPTVVHPDLAAGQRLALRTEAPSPAPVVDRGGAPLLEATPVVAVLL